MTPATILDRLLLISDLFERDMARAFAGTQLSAARMGVLWIVHHSGPVTQQALAQGLDVSARNISALVDALVTAEYIRRSPHPTDRRAVLIELTDAGHTLMTATAAEHAELSAHLLEAVDPDDRAALERGIDAMTDRLTQLLAAEAHSADRPGAGRSES